MARELSHVAADGRVQMVDVSAKPAVRRTAVAQGRIFLRSETLEKISRNQVAKGNVFATAQIAGIQAAKRTAELIPLCHPLPLSRVAVDFAMEKQAVMARCTARTTASTGVEMEALVGASLALLTIYDMCKAIDSEMRLGDVHLVSKEKES